LILVCSKTQPIIEMAMRRAGFRLGVQPGISGSGPTIFKVDLMLTGAVGRLGDDAGQAEGHSKMLATRK